MQMCDVVHDIELERERCEKSVGNVTAGQSPEPTFPVSDYLREGEQEAVQSRGKIVWGERQVSASPETESRRVSSSDDWKSAPR